MERVQVRLHVVMLERRCIVVDRRCRESKGKAKIEGYMSVSDEEAHHPLSTEIVTVLSHIATGEC